jgi:hypothetical protein
MPSPPPQDPHAISRVADFPGPIRALLERTEVYDGLDAVDLRETAKFTELTNVWGLPLHPIARPPDPSGLLEAEGGVERLPNRVLRELKDALGSEPQILIRGRLAGSLADVVYRGGPGAAVGGASGAGMGRRALARGFGRRG